MGLLWLLVVAAICYSTQTTSAWPGGKDQRTKSVAALVANNTKQTEHKINSTITAQNITQPSTNMTAAREKRGTLLNENLLERREAPKFRFSSWAGKRAEAVDEEKRAKFSSWGGKRADVEESKRAKFSSWGGKRDVDLSGERSSSWTEPEDVVKRAKFNSWAGKRTLETADDKRAKFSSWAGKPGKFNSWAGKRSDVDAEPEDDHISLGSWGAQNPDHFYLNEDKRAKFSSWAGKRNPDYLGTSWSSVAPDNRIKYYSSGIGEPGNENIMKIWQDLMSRKRARFSSWAGKRSEEDSPVHVLPETMVSYTLPELQDKRSKFSSWAGKREDPEKRKFSSWGGKRDSNDSYGESDEDKDGYPSLIVKRSVFTWSTPSLAYKRKPVFSSWGGKRSDTHTIQVRSLPIQRVMMGERNWGSLMRPIRRGPDFYAWGGKRST